jgi:heme/copper-type cytochrome/quinol oxidase subunit 1
MVMPIRVGGFGNWFIPIMIGSPYKAFPRLNNLGFWLLPPAFFILIGTSRVEGVLVLGGLFALPYLGAIAHSAPAVDLAVFSLLLAGIASFLGAINSVSTIFNMRLGV